MVSGGGARRSTASARTGVSTTTTCLWKGTANWPAAFHTTRRPGAATVSLTCQTRTLSHALSHPARAVPSSVSSLVRRYRLHRLRSADRRPRGPRRSATAPTARIAYLHPPPYAPTATAADSPAAAATAVTAAESEAAARSVSSRIDPHPPSRGAPASPVPLRTPLTGAEC